MAVRAYGLVQYSTSGGPYTGSGPYLVDTAFYQSNSASDKIVAGDGPNKLWGNDGRDRLYGKKGNDVLVGGDGKDTLYGGEGADYFVFDRSPFKGNFDRVMDFSRKEHDKIALSWKVFKAIDVQYKNDEFGDPEYDSGIGSFFGHLRKSEFRVGSKAILETDRIVYNKAKGQLFYDKDGSGAAEAIKIAQFKPGTILAATDFLII
jgi:serralysin